MKKCAFCGLENEDNAIKCKDCDGLLVKKEAVAWYFKTSILVVAFLSIGPLALPLLWFNPHFSSKAKIIISIIVIILSYYLGVMLVKSLKTITSYYQTMLPAY